MKNIILPAVILTVLLCGEPVLAQKAEGTGREHNHNGHFSPNFAVAVPQKEFSDLAPREAFFGIGGGFYGQLKNLPVDLGGSFHYYWMGSESETFHLTDPSFGDYDVESRVNGSMMPFHFHTRVSFLRTLNDFIFPYVEGMAGFRIFNTRSVIEVDDFTETPPEPETDNNVSLTWSYGYAGGLSIRMATNVMLDARVNMMHGGRARYLDPESVTFNDNQEPSFERKRSKTDVMVYQLGIKLKF